MPWWGSLEANFFLQDNIMFNVVNRSHDENLRMIASRLQWLDRTKEQGISILQTGLAVRESRAGKHPLQRVSGQFQMFQIQEKIRWAIPFRTAL